jgi:hypothetical protein
LATLFIFITFSVSSVFVGICANRYPPLNHLKF